jgi:hypothetical protein
MLIDLICLAFFEKFSFYLVRKVFSHVFVTTVFFATACFFFFNFTMHVSQAQAATLEFNSNADWEGGELLNVDAGAVTDSIQLEATGTWDARNWRTPDEPLGIGTSFASDGTFIYVIRGVGDILFWKYDSRTDKWTQLADLPGGAYYGSDLVYLNGYIYAILGGYQRTFARYSIESDTWQLMSDFPSLP